LSPPVAWEGRAPQSPGPFNSWPRGTNIFHHLVHIAEQHDGVVVEPNHAPVVGGRVDLERLRRHFATEIIGDLIHFEGELGLAVNANERRLIGDGDARLRAHEVGDGSRLDRVVHRDPALMRNRLFEVDVLHRLEDVLPVIGNSGCGHV